MYFSSFLALPLLSVNIMATTLEPPIRDSTTSITYDTRTQYFGQVSNFTSYASPPKFGVRGFRTYNAIQVRLARLILQLKTYMSENNLTKNERETLAESLRKEIDTVINSAAELEHLRQLDDQIRLIKHVYHVAVDTDYLIEFFSLTDMEEHMVSSFVHLNLELLNLHNINGIPNAGTYDCRSRVAATIESFMHWERVMESSVELPDSIRNLLESRFTEAKYLLGVAEAAVMKHH